MAGNAGNGVAHQMAQLLGRMADLQEQQLQANNQVLPTIVIPVLEKKEEYCRWIFQVNAVTQETGVYDIVEARRVQLTNPAHVVPTATVRQNNLIAKIRSVVLSKLKGECLQVIATQRPDTLHAMLEALEMYANPARNPVESANKYALLTQGKMAKTQTVEEYCNEKVALCDIAQAAGFVTPQTRDMVLRTAIIMNLDSNFSIISNDIRSRPASYPGVIDVIRRLVDFDKSSADHRKETQRVLLQAEEDGNEIKKMKTTICALQKTVLASL